MPLLGAGPVTKMSFPWHHWAPPHQAWPCSTAACVGGACVPGKGLPASPGRLWGLGEGSPRGGAGKASWRRHSCAGGWVGHVLETGRRGEGHRGVDSIRRVKLDGASEGAREPWRFQSRGREANWLVGGGRASAGWVPGKPGGSLISPSHMVVSQHPAQPRGSQSSPERGQETGGPPGCPPPHQYSSGPQQRQPCRSRGSRRGASSSASCPSSHSHQGKSGSRRCSQRPPALGWGQQEAVLLWGLSAGMKAPWCPAATL